MQLKEAERIFFESVITAPMAIQPAVMEYYGDNPPAVDVETYTTAFVIHPAKGEYIFTSSCELRKLILKPPRYNLVQMLYVKPSPKGTTDPNGNDVDDCFVTKWEVDQTQFDAIGVDASECVIFFRAKIGNFWITGEEGRFLTTKDRMALIDLTDFDGKGYYVESGEKIEWELLVLDTSSLRMLKMLNFQSVFMPLPITYPDSPCTYKKNIRVDFKTSAVVEQNVFNDTSTNTDNIGWIVEGIVNTALPTVLMVSTDALKIFDKLGTSNALYIKSKPVNSNQNPILQEMLGHPVSIIFGGLKFPKNCEIRR